MVTRALWVLAHSGVKEAEYQLGLAYSLENDLENTLYWLKRAAFQEHQKAIEMIHELIERKLI